MANMSTKYNGINPVVSVISKTGKLVIKNVPVGIIRALRTQSEKAKDSKRNCGSAANEGLKAIYYYLDTVKKVNVKNIIKSGL
jgi:hypothetical protein